MLTRTLASRVRLLRALNNSADYVKQAKRNGGHGVWSYRVPPPMPSRRATLLAEGIGGLCWFWVFWHLFTEPEHVTGEFPYNDPSCWSDMELGIPPDSAGPLHL